jgi:hypothetical protein
MKKILFVLLVLVLLVGCAPTEKAPELEDKTPAKTEVKAEETSIEKTEEKVAEVEAKPVPTRETVDVEVTCKNFLTVAEFANICEMPESQVKIDIKETEEDCWATIIDTQNKLKHTAGFTARDWGTVEEAGSELDRGLDIRNLDAETDIGERNYKFSEINRENIVWVRGSILTEIAASTGMCTKEQLLEVAKLVDSRLH